MAVSAADTPAVPAGSLSPDGERLIEETRARAGSRLRGRDFTVTLALGIPFLAIATAMAVLLPTERSFSPGLALALGLTYALAARVHFEVGIGFALPTQLVFVPMLFLLPARDVPLIVAAALVLAYLPKHLRGEWHLERALVHFVSAWYAVGPALVLALAGEPAADWRHKAPILLGALAAQFAVDLTITLIRSAALRVELEATLRAMGWPWLVDGALAPLGLLVSYVAAQRPYAFVLAVPLLALLAFLARERRAHIDHALELSHAYRGTALLLGDVVEADDQYTGAHSRDVVSLVLGVADVLGLDARERRKAEFVALLHDVGKIRIPGEIIKKPEPLTPEERAIVETHTVEGQRMLERVGGLLGDVGRLVRSCHERWDGRGYPDGLVKDAIPLVARIVCCCDAFSAMTTDRPYRKALSAGEASAELQACAGTQFDPEVVAALLETAARLDRPTLAA